MRIILGLVIMVTVAALIYFKPWAVGESDISNQKRPEGPNIESSFVTDADKFLTIAGATIRVRDEGPANAPVLVLLHGFTHSLETWDGWAERLVPDYRVIRFDLLGHGLSGPDADRRYSNAERVEFLEKVLNALDLRQVHLGGNSLGGLIAWRYAAQYPNRIEKLILVSPAAFSISGVTEVPAPVSSEMEFYLLNPSEMGARASLNFQYADGSKISDQRVSLAVEMSSHPGNPQAFVHHLEEFTLPDPTEDLARIKTPTLIMWGVQDALIPSVQGSMMAEIMPNARLKSYAFAGHVAQEELAAETASDAATFLMNNE